MAQALENRLKYELLPAAGLKPVLRNEYFSWDAYDLIIDTADMFLAGRKRSITRSPGGSQP
jgi:hypothetical protein